MKRQVSSTVCLSLVQWSVPVVISTWYVRRKVTLFFINWPNSLNVWGWKLYSKLMESFHINKKKMFQDWGGLKIPLWRKSCCLEKIGKKFFDDSIKFCYRQPNISVIAMQFNIKYMMSNDTLSLEHKQAEMPMQDSKLFFFFHSTFKGAGMSNTSQLL